jgi:hypothetical protein
MHAYMQSMLICTVMAYVLRRVRSGTLIGDEEIEVGHPPCVALLSSLDLAREEGDMCINVLRAHIYGREGQFDKLCRLGSRGFLRVLIGPLFCLVCALICHAKFWP